MSHALNGAPHAAGVLCAQVLVLASSTLDAATSTGYEFHKGAYKQTLAVLDLLRLQYPHALQAAIAVLNDPITFGVLGSERRAAQAVQLAGKLIANLSLDPLRFYDGVLPVDFHGQEAIDRANESNGAAEHAASVTQGGAQADAELDQLEAQGRQLDADIQRIHDAGGAR